VAGLLLVLFGVLLLVTRLVPGLRVWFSWPVAIMAVGAFLLIMGLLTRTPGLAVPASIIGGMGALLYWQNVTGNWGSWAYAWTLIPGMVGVGVVLAGLLGENPGESIRGGGVLIVISLVMFLVFGSFLGGLGMLGPYWPVLIIALGVLLLVGQFLARARQ
jgi:hypothetical protein